MKNYILLIILIFTVACHDRIPESQKLSKLPEIFPEYQGVTIPPDIAPLNFILSREGNPCYARFSCGTTSLVVKGKRGQIRIPEKKWQNMLNLISGGIIEVTTFEKKGEWISYEPFEITVAEERVDEYLAYRLIEPGYELWNHMGIYQRNLRNFKQDAIIENHLTDQNCVNCHSFCMQDPGKMLFHMRAKHGGTFLIQDDVVDKLNSSLSALVYPAWHPSGKFITFSIKNNTAQVFHTNHPNRIEVYDDESDIIVYNVEKQRVIQSGLICAPDQFETFPTFSPDGNKLYFCSAEARKMPYNYEEVKYNLCAIDFDPETETFGSSVDTLYNAITEGRSAKFPRISPDGNFLMYTLSDYGNFSIWHKDADLHMIDLRNGKAVDLSILNSEDVESYHSWSSNSRWVVFSSRRIDGLYTRPYLAYINEEGKASKPFLLPQKDPSFYDRFMKSYNIPEFVIGKVKVSSTLIKRVAKKE